MIHRGCTMPLMSAVSRCLAVAAFALGGCAPPAFVAAPAAFVATGGYCYYLPDANYIPVTPPGPYPVTLVHCFAMQPPDYSPDYVYRPDGQLVPKACLVGDATELPALGPHLPPGCANAHNLARMAESKSDLLHGRPHGAAPAAPTARAAQEYIYGAEPRKGILGGGVARPSGSAPQGTGAESETEKPAATR